MSLLLSNSLGGGNWVTENDFPLGQDETRQQTLECDGVCSRIAAIGKVKNEKFGGEPNKVYICFDVRLPDGDVKEFWFNETQSKHIKSNLGKHLRRWRGREFTPDELEKFTLANILGAQAHIELKLVWSKPQNRYYVNLDLLKPPIKGKEVEPIEEPYIFDIDEGRKDAQGNIVPIRNSEKTNWDKLPSNIKHIINQRDGENGYYIYADGVNNAISVPSTPSAPSQQEYQSDWQTNEEKPEAAEQPEPIDLSDIPFS